MNKKVILALVLLAITANTFVGGYLVGRRNPVALDKTIHVHEWGPWGKPSSGVNLDSFQLIQTRQCTNCGAAEWRRVEESK